MISDRVYYFIWLLIHIIYTLVTEIHEFLLISWKNFSKRLWSCFPLYSTALGDLSRIVDVSASLNKLPKHLAILVTPEAENPTGWGRIAGRIKFLRGQLFQTKDSRSEINLQTLSQIISWAWAAQIPAISLYDYNGEIKEKHEDLKYYLQEEVRQSTWAIKKQRTSSEPLKIKFHNVPNKDGNANGLNGVKTSAPLHILIYSKEDGKPGILKTTKQICEENLHTKSSLALMTESERLEAEKSMEITESRIDSCLNKTRNGLSTEPDLLIVFGNIHSTLGFLPWHIRLTEIHWLPRLPNVEVNDFVDALRRYSGCQQRFGT